MEYDAASGESLGLGSRILLFPQILQKDLVSVSVRNESGNYEVYRSEDGNLRVRGIDNPHVSLDAKQLAAFSVGAGYPNTLRKLDLSSPGIGRKADGTIDYSIYGLDQDKGYTVVGRDTAQSGYAADPSRTYTVVIGDKTLTGKGYYARLVGREAIYVISADILESTVKQPVESLVSAYAVIPTTASTYPMARDFLFAKMKLEGSLDTAEISPIIRFDYEDQNGRTNTLFETRPYVCKTELMEGYEVNNGNASTVLGLLYELSAPTCVHLGLGEGDEQTRLLAEYGISGDVFYLSYYPYLQVSSTSYGYSEDAYNLLLIGQKNEKGNYYVASFYYDMILEVEPYYLSFLDWEEKDWYTAYPVAENIAYLKTLSVETKSEAYHFAYSGIRFFSLNSFKSPLRPFPLPSVSMCPVCLPTKISLTFLLVNLSRADIFLKSS